MDGPGPVFVGVDVPFIEKMPSALGLPDAYFVWYRGWNFTVRLVERDDCLCGETYGFVAYHDGGYRTQTGQLSTDLPSGHEDEVVRMAARAIMQTVDEAWTHEPPERQALLTAWVRSQPQPAPRPLSSLPGQHHPWKKSRLN